MQTDTALRRLAGHARTDDRHRAQIAGLAEAAPFLSAFVAQQREVIRELHLPSAAAVVVLEGEKEVSCRGLSRRFRLGTLVALHPDSTLDVVNIPDPGTGCYRALFLGFPRRLEIEAARRWPALTGAHAPADLHAAAGLPLVGPLAAAVVHFAEALGGPGHSAALCDHRLLEVMLLLAEAGALRFRPKYRARSVTEGLRLLLRHRLHEDWTAARAAAALSLSEATLRRRLAGEGAGFAAVLREERLAAAHLLIGQRGADVADAMAATGFRSRSHFARQFRDRYGVLPSQAGTGHS